MNLREKIIIVLTIIGLTIVYLFGLTIDVTRDAAKYGYISKEIIQHGRWFRLSIMGEPYFQKPQFLFWLSAISFKLSGISNFTFKLPIFLYSLIGCFAVFKLGESIYSRKTGLYAASIILFSIIFLLYNMDIHTDTVLFTNVALSLWMLHRYLLSKRRIYLVFTGIAIGLSFLTKGPFGVFIPVMSGLAFYISQKESSKKLLPNLMIILLIALPFAALAIVPFYQEKGFKGIWFFIWENNFNRIKGQYGKGSNDYFYYLHNLLYLFLPWSIFMILGLFFLFKNLLMRKFSSNEHFIFWGTFTFLFIISISRNKLPNYLMSALPLLAIITARGWEEVFEKKLSKIVVAHQIILYLLISLLFIGPVIFFQNKNIIAWSIFFLIDVACISLIKTSTKERTVYFKTITTMLSLAIFLNLYAFPFLFNLQAEPKAARLVNEKSNDDEKIFYLNPESLAQRDSISSCSRLSGKDFNNVLSELHFYRSYELMFYCQKPVNYIEKTEQVKQIAKEGKSWIYTDQKGLAEIYQSVDKKIETYPISNVKLNNPSKYLNPWTRKKSVEEMYLIHIN